MTKEHTRGRSGRNTQIVEGIDSSAGMDEVWLARNDNCERRTMRRAFREALMSAGTVTILLLVLVAIDDRVREAVSRVFTTGQSMELVGTGHQLNDLTHAIAEAARSQSLAHAPLLVFALAAGVLVVFMLRT